jgi:Holliday junction resolvase RusA-like endonuclease
MDPVEVAHVTTVDEVLEHARTDASLEPLMTAHVVDIPAKSWKGTRLNANDRTGKALYSKDQKNFWIARGKRAGEAILRAHGQLEYGRIIVTFTWPDKVHRDASNLQPTVKAIVDGMIRAGLFQDDTDTIVTGQDARGIPGNKGTYGVFVTVLQ